MIHSHRWQTDYARLSPTQARTVLAVLVLVAAFCAALTLSPLARGYAGKQRDGPGDVELYRAEVERIRAGEGYYQAAAAELHQRGYPTRSVFNWRTPLPMWLIAHLPDAALGKALLGLLALALWLAAFEALAREQPGALFRPVACALLLSGPLMLCILGDLYVMPVLWAGVLIALSAVCYGLGRPALGVACGLAAVFFRELALPYCLLAVGFAWWTGRRRELLWWLAGLAAWAAFYAGHCTRLSELIQSGDRAHAHGWIQFAGAGFVISAVQINAYLLLLPQWITALYFAVAMCGFAGWSTPLGRRCGLTACLYVVVLGVVGQEFNQYWGCLVAPLWCFGAAHFPASLRDLWKAAASVAFPGRCRGGDAQHVPRH